MSNQIKISYIIPCFNAEAVLARAVDSILHGTTLGSVEVIIVENGSSDKTTEVAKACMERYNKMPTSDGKDFPELVRLFHSEKGVSNARNKGIEEARGQWVAFVDADDQMTDDGIHLMLLDSLTSKADLIVYSHMAGVDRRAVVNGPIEYQTYGEDDVESIRIRMITNPTKYMQAWAKLFRLETIRRFKVNFNPLIPLSEDSDFVLRFTHFCRGIDFSSAIVYRYSVDIPSTIRVYDGTKAERFADALERTSEAVMSEGKSIQKAFKQYILMNMNVIMVREVWELTNPHNQAEKLASQKEIVAKPVFAKAIRETSVFQCHSMRILPVLCLTLRWHKLASVIYKKRVKQNAKLSEQSAMRGR